MSPGHRIEGARRAAETRRRNRLADNYTSRVKQKRLTPRFIDSVKKATDGTRAEFRDTEVKAFALRVTESGAKSYVMNMRWPAARCRCGGPSATRR